MRLLNVAVLRDTAAIKSLPEWLRIELESAADWLDYYHHTERQPMYFLQRSIADNTITPEERYEFRELIGKYGGYVT